MESKYAKIYELKTKFSWDKIGVLGITIQTTPTLMLD